MRICLAGPAGAGKSIQAKKLSEKYGIPHVSSGTLLRREILRKTDLGNKLKKLFDNGELAPTGIVIEMMAKELLKKKYTKGVIVDGSPRTREEAKALSNIMRTKGRPFDYIIELNAPIHICQERLLNRGRFDDHIDAIKRRHKIFKDNINGIVNSMIGVKHIVVQSFGSTIRKVTNNIIKALENNEK